MSDIDYSGLVDSIKSETDKIVMQVKETEENFIFQTLQSFSENIVEREVSKEELSRAIINYFNPQHPYLVRQGNRMVDICTNCGKLLDYDHHKIEGLKYIYCYKCGRRMKIR